MLLAYVFLIICAFCLCGMSLLRKQYQIKTGTSVFPTLIFMAAYSFFVVVAGAVYLAVSGNISEVFSADGVVLSLGVVLAVTITATTVIAIVGTAYGSLSILIMMSTLGTLCLSAVYGLLFDGERNAPDVYMSIGFILVAVIIVLSFVGKTDNGTGTAKSKKSGVIYKLLCLAIFFTNGVALVIYSIMTKYRSGYGSVEFVVLYSFFALCFCACLTAVWKLVKGKRAVAVPLERENRKLILYIGVYALLFGIGEVMSLYCTALIPIIIQAPLSFVIELVIITFFDHLIYKSKITGINILQMVLAVISSVLFALS